MFISLQSLSILVPLLTWRLREGSQKNLSLKCRVNMTTTHMGQLLEQHFHLSVQSRLCPNTQVSMFTDMWLLLSLTDTFFSKFQSYSRCRKPNNGCLRHPSPQAWLLRILCLHTSHLLPQSLLDVLPTWTWRRATTVGRLGKDVYDPTKWSITVFQWYWNLDGIKSFITMHQQLLDFQKTN